MNRKKEMAFDISNNCFVQQIESIDRLNKMHQDHLFESLNEMDFRLLVVINKFWVDPTKNYLSDGICIH